MRRPVFGQPVGAYDIETLTVGGGPSDFVRLCGALIGHALAEGIGASALPHVSDRVTVPDGGVDAEYTTPLARDVPETGGLVGPGRTVFQFKYRDPRRTSLGNLVRELVSRLKREAPRLGEGFDRYVLMTNLHLAGAQTRRLVEALARSSPAFADRPVVVWGAAEIATQLNLVPHLRHAFFAEGELCTLDVAEEELRASYGQLGWPAFVGRERERAAIEAFASDPAARVLEVIGPRYAGKTRLVIEGLRARGATVLWATGPDGATWDLFRDCDSPPGSRVLVVDRCDARSVGELRERGEARQYLKTILVHERLDPTFPLGGTVILPVGPLPSEETGRLVEAVSPRGAFLQHSWLAQATGGLPGLIVHVAAVLREASLVEPAEPEALQHRLGALLEARCLAGLEAGARQALEALSLLAPIGIGGDDVGQERDVVCRAIGVSPDDVTRHVDPLARLGLAQRRGRFVEVVPPLLAEHLATRALTRPARTVAELLCALGPGALLRFLDRFRNLRGEPVEQAVAEVLSAGGWFPDLDALVRQARQFEVLAPAAPRQALACLDRTLGTASAEDLRDRVREDARRALVTALENLALRAETFEGAARHLMALAEAENEAWMNNATGVVPALFAWNHPELSASLTARVRSLQVAAGEKAPARRRIVAEACGRAFSELGSFPAHRAKGPAVPEAPYRARTWDEVRDYGRRILALLEKLARDEDPDVRAAATTALLQACRPLITLSATPEGADPLGRRVLGLVVDIGRSVSNATVRADAVTELELVQDWLIREPTREWPSASELTRQIEQAITELTGGSLEARLWRAVGPSSRLLREDGARDEAKLIEEVAADLVREPAQFERLLDWLLSDQAARRDRLLRVLGREDRGGPLFGMLVERAGGPGWPYAFAAYALGWASEATDDVETALDMLVTRHPAAWRGVVRATGVLAPSARTVERLLRILASGAGPRGELVHAIAVSTPWRLLGPETRDRMLAALDDGTAETRADLLPALVDLALDPGEGMSPVLEERAWLYLRGSYTVVVRDREGLGYWDALSSRLGRAQPGRLAALIEELVLSAPGADEGARRWQRALPRVWETLAERDPAGLIRVLVRWRLRLGSVSFESALAELIDPARDRSLLHDLTSEGGVEAARAIALHVGADRDGFWDLARDLLGRWADDDVLKGQLLSQVTSGPWSGSAVPMIAARLDGVRRLLADADPRVAGWARQAAESLEGWMRREQREDREGWLWDSRIRQSEFEAILVRKGSPEWRWAVGRLLKDAPPTRVLELLTPTEILEALAAVEGLDESQRGRWEAYARHWSPSA